MISQTKSKGYLNISASGKTGNQKVSHGRFFILLFRFLLQNWFLIQSRIRPSLILPNWSKSQNAEQQWKTGVTAAQKQKSDLDMRKHFSEEWKDPSRITRNFFQLVLNPFNNLGKDGEGNQDIFYGELKLKLSCSHRETRDNLPNAELPENPKYLQSNI